MLTITLLGTAATMPLPDRALTTAVAECVGHSLLFDCGEGTQAAARRAGVNLMKLDAICLTHYHGDHIFGLPGLLQTLGCQGRTKPLVLYGPAGMAEVWPALRALTGPLPYPIRAGERVVAPAEVLGPPRRGLKFVFSGDTAPCPALEQAAQGADLFICDATYAEPEQEAQARQYGHSTFGQGAAMAARAGAKRLWLAHYSPMITDPEEYKSAAQEIFPAAECGYDGKTITLQFEEERP